MQGGLRTDGQLFSVERDIFRQLDCAEQRMSTESGISSCFEYFYANDALTTRSESMLTFFAEFDQNNIFRDSLKVNGDYISRN